MQMPDQTGVVNSLGRGSIADPFLGNVVEIAVVTRDHKRTMEGLWRLGIGPFVQSGSWLGRNHFAFFETEAATTTCLETYVFPNDREYPEPEEWCPPRA